MARRRNKHTQPAKPLDTARLMNYTTYQVADNGMEFKVHHIRAAAKEYTCPGCNGVINVGQSHVVAWTEDSWFGAEAGQAARRHWHNDCWKSRGHLASGW